MRDPMQPIYDACDAARKEGKALRRVEISPAALMALPPYVQFGIRPAQALRARLGCGVEVHHDTDGVRLVFVDDDGTDAEPAFSSATVALIAWTECLSPALKVATDERGEATITVRDVTVEVSDDGEQRALGPKVDVAFD